MYGLILIFIFSFILLPIIFTIFKIYVFDQKQEKERNIWTLQLPIRKNRFSINEKKEIFLGKEKYAKINNYDENVLDFEIIDYCFLKVELKLKVEPRIIFYTIKKEQERLIWQKQLII